MNGRVLSFRGFVLVVVVASLVRAERISYADTRAVKCKNTENGTADDLHFRFKEKVSIALPQSGFENERTSTDGKTHNLYGHDVLSGGEAKITATSADGVDIAVEEWWWTQGGTHDKDGDRYGAILHEADLKLLVSGGVATGGGLILVSAGTVDGIFRTTPGDSVPQTAAAFREFLRGLTLPTPLSKTGDTTASAQEQSPFSLVYVETSSADEVVFAGNVLGSPDFQLRAYVLAQDRGQVLSIQDVTGNMMGLPQSLLDRSPQPLEQTEAGTPQKEFDPAEVMLTILIHQLIAEAALPIDRFQIARIGPFDDSNRDVLASVIVNESYFPSLDLSAPQAMAALRIRDDESIEAQEVDQFRAYLRSLASGKASLYKVSYESALIGPFSTYAVCGERGPVFEPLLSWIPVESSVRDTCDTDRGEPVPRDPCRPEKKQTKSIHNLLGMEVVHFEVVAYGTCIPVVCPPTCDTMSCDCTENCDHTIGWDCYIEPCSHEDPGDDSCVASSRYAYSSGFKHIKVEVTATVPPLVIKISFAGILGAGGQGKLRAQTAPCPQCPPQQ